MTMAVSQNISGCQKADVTLVVNRFYVSLYRFALCLTTSHSDAADLVQQTFVRFSQRPLQTDDCSKIKCWLFAALHRYYLMEISGRTNHLKRGLTRNVHNPAPRNPERSEFAAACELPPVLALVSEACRPAVSLFYLQDFSVREIAQILEMPIDVVRSRLIKGKVQLTLILKTDPEPKAASAY